MPEDKQDKQEKKAPEKKAPEKKAPETKPPEPSASKKVLKAMGAAAGKIMS